MRHPLLILALPLALAACHASESECTKLLDHFVDVEGDADIAGRFREQTTKLVETLARVKRAYRDGLAERFVGRCQAQLSPAEVRCALAARDEAGLDQCEGR